MTENIILTNTIEDLMFLVGYKKKPAKGSNASKWTRDIETRAENDWADGKDAKDNPYPANSQKANVWYRAWLNCNKNL